MIKVYCQLYHGSTYANIPPIHVCPCYKDICPQYIPSYKLTQYIYKKIMVFNDAYFVTYLLQFFHNSRLSLISHNFLWYNNDTSYSRQGIRKAGYV